MAGPTVVTHGSDELRTGSCAGPSPARSRGASCSASPVPDSDLAGLATRAVRDGDEWVITGQKVWNTLAHIADRGMLVARTDPEVPKHKGLTYFALDMHAPGVEVRPLRQMTGEAEFNEVYLTEVRVHRRRSHRRCRRGLAGGHDHPVQRADHHRRGYGSPGRGSGSIAEALRIWQQRGLPPESG